MGIFSKDDMAAVREVSASDNSEKIRRALHVALEYGGIDGGHHKMWVIDQMVRELTGNRYDEFIREVCNGEDGPDTYEWDTGIAP